MYILKLREYEHLEYKSLKKKTTSRDLNHRPYALLSDSVANSFTAALLQHMLT